MHNGRGSRAVGGVGSDDLGGVDGRSIGVVGRHTSHEGGGSCSSNGETHDDDSVVVSWRIKVVCMGIELVKAGSRSTRER